MEELANAARFIIFNGEEHVITLKAGGTGKAIESMEKLVPIIKDLIESEGYRVIPGPLEERQNSKTGISYKTIKITVQENEYSVPLPDGVNNVEELTEF